MQFSLTIFSLGFGFILSIFSSIIGTILFLKFRNRAHAKPLNRILNFGNDELLFVFSHRNSVKEAILPRTSTEDFMAINNLTSALIKIKWSKKHSVRDTQRLTEANKQKNIFSICSCKSNSFTKAVEDDLLQKGKNIYRAVPKKDSSEWQIIDNDGNYPSATYGELAEYKSKNEDHMGIPNGTFNDIAYITKTKNPFNALNKVIIVAGIRGIGTWGAAECLKKNWDDIYRNLNDKGKSSDFTALLRIKYDKFDIIKIDVINVRSI